MDLIELMAFELAVASLFQHLLYHGRRWSLVFKKINKAIQTPFIATSSISSKTLNAKSTLLLFAIAICHIAHARGNISPS
jgi:hypothetical protein